MKRRRGIFLADAITGLAIVGVIAGVLAVGINGHQAAMFRLADHRAAARLAETAITCLQAEREVPHPAESRDKISWRKVDGDAAPAGMQWMEVDATVNGSTERLIGLTPHGLAGGER